VQSIMRGWPALSTCPATLFQAAKKTLAPPVDLAVPGLGSGGMNRRAHLLGQLLRIPVLALALSVVIAALDLRSPDPDVLCPVLNEPPERDPWPQGCAPLCRDGRG
jgi:hypothetical protein